MEIADPIAFVLENKTPDLWVIAPKKMVFDAIELMSEKNVGALPVLDQGELVGIVSERDYTRKVFLGGKSSRDTPIKDIMTKKVFTISPKESVGSSLQMMTEKRVRHLPVVQSDKLIGIVTIGDLVKWTISAQDAMIDHLEGYIKGSYPA